MGKLSFSNNKYNSIINKQIIIEKSLLQGKRLKVAKLIAYGCKVKDIADRLYISLPAVNKHIYILKEKTGCTSLSELSACIGLILAFNGYLSIRAEDDKYFINKDI